MIQNLSESRLFRDKNFFEKYNVREVADLLFQYLLVLTVLKKEFESLEFARQYAAKTVLNGGFRTWRYSQTDLGLMLFALLYDKGKTIPFQDHVSNSAELQRLTIPEQEIVLFLRRIFNNSDDPSMDNRMLLKLERELRVTRSDFKNVRRIAPYWAEATRDQKKVAATRLAQSLRRSAPTSELLPMLLEVIKQFDLEVQDAPKKDEDTTINHDKQLALGALAGIGTGAAYGIWKANRKGEQRRAGYVFKESEDLATIDPTDLKSRKFKQSMNAKGYKVVQIDPVKFVQAFEKAHPTDAVRTDRTNGAFDNELNKYHQKKLDRLNQFLNTNPDVEIELPFVGIEKNVPYITDGRHRLYLAAKQGLSSIPVMVQNSHVKQMTAEYGALNETTSAGMIASSPMPIGKIVKRRP